MKNNIDHDFLWECALINKSEIGNDSNWIVPNKEDLNPSITDGEVSHFETQHVIFPLVSPVCHTLSNGITLNITEIRDFGVVDIIGGELWQAAYYLCAYLLSPDGNFLLHGSTYELGAGLGIPSLLISKLRQLNYIKNNVKEIYISDYEPRVLAQVNTLIDQLFENPLTIVNNTVETNLNDDDTFSIHTVKLDWTSYNKNGDDAINSSNSSSSSSSSVTKFDYFIGSALVYAPCHIVLADTILHFFKTTPTCKEGVIIQLKSRPGFSLFLNRLKRLNMLYTLQEIDQSILDIYNQIQITRGGHNNQIKVFFPSSILPSSPFPSTTNNDNNSGNNDSILPSSPFPSTTNNDNNSGNNDSMNTNSNINDNNKDSKNNNNIKIIPEKIISIDSSSLHPDKHTNQFSNENVDISQSFIQNNNNSTNIYQSKTDDISDFVILKIFNY